MLNQLINTGWTRCSSVFVFNFFHHFFVVWLRSGFSSASCCIILNKYRCTVHGQVAAALSDNSDYRLLQKNKEFLHWQNVFGDMYRMGR